MTESTGNLPPVHLVVATPCFGGQVTSLYLSAMMKLQTAMRAFPSYKLTLELQEGDALITRARANLAAAFLDNPEATHLLFIDADIGFEPEQVFRLIGCGADLCAAIYPIKRIDWTKVRRAFDAGKANPGAAALHYVLEVADRDRITTNGDFVQVRYAGTGFLMVRRAALAKMCAHYAELNFRKDHTYNTGLEDSQNRFALFDCLIDPETGVYLSEDFSFCKRWTDLGGEIWADLTSKLNHAGPMTFHGDLSTQIEAG